MWWAWTYNLYKEYCSTCYTLGLFLICSDFHFPPNALKLCIKLKGPYERILGKYATEWEKLVYKGKTWRNHYQLDAEQHKENMAFKVFFIPLYVYFYHKLSYVDNFLSLIFLV